MRNNSLDQASSFTDCNTVLFLTVCPSGSNTRHMVDPDLIMNCVSWSCSQEQDGQAICTATPRDPRARIEPFQPPCAAADEVWTLGTQTCPPIIQPGPQPASQSSNELQRQTSKADRHILEQSGAKKGCGVRRKDLSQRRPHAKS